MPTTLTENNKHVAAFAFPFGSHPGPLLNLVIKLALAAPDVIFSFFNTDTSNKTLFSKPNIPDNIKPFSVSDGMPEGHVLSNDPIEKLNLFLQAGPENLKKGLELAVSDTKIRITCILADAFVTSSLLLAQELHVPWIALWTANSCSLSTHIYTDLIRKRQADSAKVDEERTLGFIPGLSKFQIEDLPSDVVNGGEGESLFSRTLGSMGRVLPQAKAVAMSFIEELDPPDFVQHMKSKLQCVCYVGFLSLTFPQTPLPLSETDATGCLSWLDRQCAKSVAYISFGTVVTPPPHELVAIAEALEESGIPFLWSLKDNAKSLLPDGFLERTSKNGKIVPWAPQTQVLAHNSIGVFVTHCGCSSVSESISNGVPMICRPFFGDQGMSGRMVEDIWGIGVIIEGGVFTKNALTKSLNLILVQEEGKKKREKAQVLKEIAHDAVGTNGSATKDLRTLVELISCTCH